MWYRLAEQGLYSPKTTTKTDYHGIGENMIDLLRNFVVSCLENEIVNGKKIKKINIDKLNQMVKSSELGKYVTGVVVDPNLEKLEIKGEYKINSKEIAISPTFENSKAIDQMLTTLKHEMVHATSPIPYQDLLDEREIWRKKYLSGGTREENEKAIQRLIELNKKIDAFWGGSRGRDNIIKDGIKYFTDEEIRAQTVDIYAPFEKNKLIRIYSQFYKKKPNGLQSFLNDIRQLIVESNNLLILGDEIEKLPQNGLKDDEKFKYLYDEINRLFTKINLKSIDKEIIGKIEELELKYKSLKREEVISGGVYRNNKLIKFNSPILDYLPVDKDALLIRLTQIKDPKFFTNFQKYLSSQLFGIEQILNVKKPDFVAFSKSVRDLESVAKQNPGLWQRFTNSKFFNNRFPSAIVQGMKNFGKQTQLLSSNLKAINLNSPYWQLLEPAIEFSLVKFGEYLESPEKFETDISSLTTEPIETWLSQKVNEILSDSSIKNKIEYFNKNYTEELNKLPQPKKDIILRKLGFITPQSRLQQNPSDSSWNYKRFMEIGKKLNK